MSFLVPTILLSAAAGVLVDRLDVRMALIVPNLVRTLLTLGLALAGDATSPLLLVLNLGCQPDDSVVLTPAEASMIPRIVPKPQLETAMGIFNLTLQASFAVGFAFLGPLHGGRSRGRRSTLGVVDRVLRSGDHRHARPAVGAAGRVIEPGVATAERSRSRSAELREGLRAISRRPRGEPAAAAPGRGGVIVGVIGVLGPGLALSLGLDPTHLIVIVLPLGLGVVGGVAGLRWFGARLSRRQAAETGLISLGLLAIGDLGRPEAVGGGARACRSFRRSSILAFCAGAAYAATTVSAQTALFENMPPGLRGRISGVLASIVSATSLIAVLIAGPLADAMSAQVVIVVISGGVIVLAAWSAMAFGPRPRSDVVTG